MGISVGGLASGLDVDGIIGQLLQIEQRPLLNLQRDIAFLEAKNAAYQDLDSRLSSLRNATQAFNSDSLFNKVGLTSTDLSVVSGEATNEAASGKYRVNVMQIATAHRIGAQGFVDDSSTGISTDPNGTFEFSIGDGDALSIDVNTTTTLRQLADAINNSGEKIRADIVNDGTATNPYRLVLSSTEEGTDGTITIAANDTVLDFDNPQIEEAVADEDNTGTYAGTATSSGTYTGTGNKQIVVEIVEAGDTSGGAGAAVYRYSLDGGVTFVEDSGFLVDDSGPIALAEGVEINFTNGTDLAVDDAFRIDVFDPLLQEAKDAVLEVNGISILKQTNTIDDVFDGMTFELLDDSGGKEITLTVSRSSGDVSGALTGFVGAYNGVIGFLTSQFSFDPTADDGAPPILNGDSAARSIQQRLKQFVTGRLPGLTGATVSALGELGVESSEETGLLSMNTSKLDGLLSSDPAAVERLLTRFGEVVSGDFTYVRRSGATQPGEYGVVITSSRTRAQIAGAQAATDIAGADETLTIDLARTEGGDQQAVVALTAGMTAAQQVTAINAEFTTQAMDVTAYLDAEGKLTLRSNQFGAGFDLTMVSSKAAGANTSGVGNAAINDAGTDLAGLINGHAARVLDETHLKGAEGFAEEDFEILVSDDIAAGSTGTIRVTDGLGESLPDLIDSLTSGSGILKSRTDGTRRSIETLDEQVSRQQDRITRSEERLRRRFVNLEVTLSQLQAQGDFLTQQLASLPNFSQSKR